MATVYQSGKLIPIHNCTIIGAVSVLLEDPNEIKAFLGLCILAPQIPENPIESVYKAIGDPKFDLTMWEKWLQKAIYTGDKRFKPQATISELPNFDEEYYGSGSDIEFLVTELSFIFDAWKLQKANQEEISLIISIANPEGDEKIEIESDDPAFVIYQGSVEYALKFAGIFIKTTKILFSIFSKVDSVKQRNLGFALRERQRPNSEPLENIDDIKNDTKKIEILKKQKVVVIFLHGLLSTDLGTFDIIIKELKLLKNKNLGMYGYPHNTLAPIKSNAVDLTDIIRKLFEGVQKPFPAIYFVCHSRGGLLARSTAVRLYDKSEKYKEIIKQAITFGTPHEGSELAEKPDDLKALYVASQFYKAYGFLHGFGELLQLFGEPKEYKGITDLKLREQNPDGFIEKLRDEEEHQVKGEDKHRHLIIKAIGGKANDNEVPEKEFITRKINSFGHYVANRIMDENNHDLVVRTASSVSTTIGLEIIGTWDCNHFQYFHQKNHDKFKFVSELIAEELQKKGV